MTVKYDFSSGFFSCSFHFVWLQALGCVLFMLCYGEHPFEDSAKLRIINGKYTIPESDTQYTVFHDLLSKYLSVFAVCLSVSLFVCLTMSVCLSVSISVSVCLSVCLSLFSLFLSLSLSGPPSPPPTPPCPMPFSFYLFTPSNVLAENVSSLCLLIEVAVFLTYTSGILQLFVICATTLVICVMPSQILRGKGEGKYAMYFLESHQL